MTGLARTALFLAAAIAAFTFAGSMHPAGRTRRAGATRGAMASSARKTPSPRAVRRRAPAPVEDTDAAAPALGVAPDGKYVATGRVVAPDGSPIVGASVVLLGAGGRLDRTSSAEDGSFHLEFTVFPTGESAVRVAASAPTRAPAATPWAMTVRGRARDVGAVVLAEAGRIAGRVVDAADAPVAGAAVAVEPVDSASLEEWDAVTVPMSGAGTRTDDEGRFEIRLPGGRYSLRFSSADAGDWWSEARIVATNGDDVVLKVPDARAPRDVARVVRAVDENGAALPEFITELSAGGGRAEAAAEDGSASVRLVGVAPFTLTVSAPGREPVVVEHVEDREDALVVALVRAPELVEPPHIRGTIVRLDGGPPATFVARAVAFDGGATASAPADESGAFDVVAPGDGACRVFVAGEIRATDGDVRVGGSTTAWPGDADVRVIARPCTSLVVEFALENGAAADAGSVNVVDERPGGASRYAAFAASTARVVVPDVDPDAVCRVEACARRGSEWLRSVVVHGAAPGGAPVVARFRRGGTVSGVVVREDGTPVAAAVVANVADYPHGWTFWADVEGRFLLTSMDRAFEKLRASAPGLEMAGPDVLAESDGAPVRIVMRTRTR